MVQRKLTKTTRGGGHTFTFIENNGEGNAIEEMELMRSCNNAIIANSTFSWWAAYLINNEYKKIVMPTHFLYYKDITQDLVPDWSFQSKNEQWIAIDWCWGEIQTSQTQKEKF